MSPLFYLFMIRLDGRRLGGGGQILRSALALAGITQKAFLITNIRHNRAQPGLRAQHLFAVRAASEWCNAQVTGDFSGSEEVIFTPHGLAPRNIKIDIGTAGSISLLLQTLIPMALFGSKKIKIGVRGGTDVRWAPTLDYFSHVFLPAISSIGTVAINLVQRGYYPKGEGVAEIRVTPGVDRMAYEDTTAFLNAFQDSCEPFAFFNRENIIQIKGVSHASKSLQRKKVAERQSKSATYYLSEMGCPISIKNEYQKTSSPGSGITIWAQYRSENPIALGASALGEKGLPAEKVGEAAGNRLKDEISSFKGVDSFLADQLLLYLGLRPGSGLAVREVSKHCLSNRKTIEAFLPIKFTIRKNIIKCVLK